MQKPKTRIVIVGGGFGGLETAFSLSELLGGSARITLLDRSGRHSFIPSIHEIISGKKTPRDISIPLDVVLPGSVKSVVAEVEAIDLEGRNVKTSEGTVDFDYLVLACGSANNFFGVHGAEENVCLFRTPADAEKIRTELVRLLSDKEGRVSIVVAGGGPEGVEVAGELADALKESSAPARGALIELVESGDRLLKGLPGQAHEIAMEYLTRIGIRIRTGERIIDIKKAAVVLGSGTELPASLTIWTGGVKPSRLTAGLHLPKDAAGWIEVTEFLNCPTHRYVFCIGDAVSIWSGGEYVKLERLAYHAIDQGIVAALNIKNLISGQAPFAYEPKQKPQLISMGRDMGIFLRGKTVRRGAWVVALKRAVETRHLLSYISRPLYSSIVTRLPFTGTLTRIRTALPL